MAGQVCRCCEPGFARQGDREMPTSLHEGVEPAAPTLRENQNYMPITSLSRLNPLPPTRFLGVTGEGFPRHDHPCEINSLPAKLNCQPSQCLLPAKNHR